MASVSLFQYEKPTMARPSPRPITAPPRPKIEPMPTMSPPRAASRMVVFTVLRNMRSAYGRRRATRTRAAVVRWPPPSLLSRSSAGVEGELEAPHGPGEDVRLDVGRRDRSEVGPPP